MASASAMSCCAHDRMRSVSTQELSSRGVRAP
eukprot:CAMPEP_0176271756 /NCGR_PEP_ID=MMETSP0121_2-20121125/45366_1 /TAXON_ID=160619 /ORGANISM="Kryptoperidinium foliaceum, Strain CCMP 1326" /LENGTH=31 /DNA_ID= /DNA_START= /DNA_END= /DNA_ORIENTATION=